jgi:tRNA(fMet)-specific endonuclease VapC
MWLLDTDHVSILEYSGNPAAERLRAKLLALRPEDYGVSIISHEEQCRGWLARISENKKIVDQVDLYRRLRKQLDHYWANKVIDFDEHAAIEFQKMKPAKVRVKTMDLRIASITLSRDAILLTRNTGDFIKIPGLRFEDWTKE